MSNTTTRKEGKREGRKDAPIAHLKRKPNLREAGKYALKMLKSAKIYLSLNMLN